MFKRAIVVALFLLLAFSLAACDKGESKLPSTVNGETQAPTAVPAQEKAENKNAQQKPDTKNDVDYKVTELICSKSDNAFKYDIKYPQISGLSDQDKQKRINGILKDEALKVLKYYENPFGSVELNINYKVSLKDANVLSIQYSGVGSVDTAAHPNSLFYTTNIDINTGNRIRLKDVVNIDKKLADKFLSGGFKALWPEQSEALEHHTSEEMQESFKKADSLDSIGTEEQSDVFSYFTTDSLGISISVGHAMGDHAEFEIKYQDLNDNIKTENEIWKDLLH